MPHLLDEVEEARVFRRLRTRRMATHLRQLLATSRLRVGLAVTMSTVFWLAMFAVMYEGFTFLEQEAGAFKGPFERNGQC